MSTLDYYNVNADTYFEDTVRADVTSLYSHFEGLIKPGASILDLGCGSGRDSKHFLDAGFTVTAVDGSQELCKRAEMLLAVPVRNLLFQDLDYSEQFDAVWACASLLHVPRHDIQTVKGSRCCGTRRNRIRIIQVWVRRTHIQRSLFF